MRKTFQVEKAGFKFTIHSREFDNKTGAPITKNPTIEFEVLDGKDYADAEDFFGVFDEVTTLAENYDLISEAIAYTDTRTIDDIKTYNSDLCDLIDTAIDMAEGWLPVKLPEEIVTRLHNFSEKIHSIK